MSTVTEIETCDPIEGCGEQIRGDYFVDADERRGDRLLCLPCAFALGFEICEDVR